MKKVFAAAISLLVIGGVSWLVIARRNAPGQSTREAQSERAPAFELQNYEGKTVRISDWAGKPLVINAWASWCPFCGKELVDFAAAQKEFGGQVVIIAVDRAETRETAKLYTDELGVSGSMVFLLDPRDSFYQSIGGFSMPETIFINQDGVIAFHKRGPMDIQEMRERIRQLLNE